MSILADTQIIELCEHGSMLKKPMISPFIPTQRRERERDATIQEMHWLNTHPHASREEFAAFIGTTVNKVRFDPLLGPQVLEKIISWGLSSYGYDVQLDRTFKIFTNINSNIIDPLKMSDACYVDYEGDCCIIPPNSYILGHTVETFCIPRDVMVVALGKSTYARAGAIINVTPVEPGFEGQVVIEISNATPLPMKVYAGMGISQFLFFKGDQECLTSYADRLGKYQGQTGLTTVRL